MPLNEQLRRAVEKSRRQLAEMTPEENSQAAGLLRDTKSQLGSARQRELAEELAVEFEERARSQAPRPTPS